MKFRQTISVVVISAFLATCIAPVSSALAAPLLGLPEPGTMVALSAAYKPATIRGLTVHKDNPFLFDFIIDRGDEAARHQDEYLKLVKYFMAALAVPAKDLWVNLSPYEKGRVIADSLGQTDLGQDMLAQDYMLKQVTASLIYPEKELGKKFWDNIYAQVQEQYHANVNVPINTFNKVWIVADKAEIFERGQTAFVTSSHLKVMLEEDYFSAVKHGEHPGVNAQSSSGKPENMTQNVIRTIVLPAIEQEVNTGKNFAALRQIFNAVLLAGWYKNSLKNAILNDVYANKNNVSGIELADKTTREQIYTRYLQAYKRGVFNYIKEDTTAPSAAPRKYFSGGLDFSNAMAATIRNQSANLTSDAIPAATSLDRVRVFTENQQSNPETANAAMEVPQETLDFFAWLIVRASPDNENPININPYIRENFIIASRTVRSIFAPDDKDIQIVIKSKKEVNRWDRFRPSELAASILGVAKFSRENALAFLKELLLQWDRYNALNPVEREKLFQNVLGGMQTYVTAHKHLPQIFPREGLKGDATGLLAPEDLANEDSAMRGGIDLIKSQDSTDVRKQGAGVQMTVDQAMITRIQNEGIGRLVPRIISVERIESIWPLFSMSPPG